MLATRISFMNELANLAEILGADIESVRKGIGSDPRIGYDFLYAGCGYGGSCFPKDVKALIKTANTNKYDLKVLSAVEEANDIQKKVLTKKIKNHYGESLAGKHFAIWGLAFKPNTDDMREAPSVVIIKKLLEYGATVAAYDPAAHETAKFELGDSITYAENEYDVLNNADALLILTEWNEFRNPDFEIVRSKLLQPLIFDGRNIFVPEKMQELQFTYFGIGRKPIINSGE